MKSRSLAGFLVLAVVAAVLTLSCSLDYLLDFELSDPYFVVGGEMVSVDYSLSNSGSRAMDNATIKIQVSINDGAQEMEMSTPGVDLAAYGTATGTLIFTFSGFSVTEATAIVVGAGWDEQDSWD